MKFFDWLYSSKDNHDLFEYGIPGKHWQAVGDNQIKLLDEAKNYNFPGYELTWNPAMIRLNSDLDETVKKYSNTRRNRIRIFAARLGKFQSTTPTLKRKSLTSHPKLILSTNCSRMVK